MFTRILLVLAATMALVVPLTAASSTSATAATGNCAGTIAPNGYRKLIYNGTAIGELVVYWDAATGTTCARLNHLGPAYGVPFTTTIDMSGCSQTVNQGSCTIDFSRRVADGPYPYSYYAGPIRFHSATRTCVWADGEIYYQGAWRWVGGVMGCP